ncbi:MAG: hypothetical protein K1000chlam4_00971 [Chlamydiae bacterium]|nr:hypothetical protein [Chlamydiota bacterium]
MTHISSISLSQNVQALYLAGLLQNKSRSIWTDFALLVHANNPERPIFSVDVMEKVFMLVAQIIPEKMAWDTFAKIRTVCRQWKEIMDRHIIPVIFRKAEQKDPSMLNLVGLALLSRWKDEQKAFAHFTEAAAQGHLAARANQRRCLLLRTTHESNVFSRWGMRSTCNLEKSSPAP